MKIIQKFLKKISENGMSSISRKILLKISNYIKNLYKNLYKKLLNIYFKRIFIQSTNLDLDKNKLFPPDYIDLINLYNQIKKLKPKNILELGSGQSTIVIASVLKELEQQGHQCAFYSIDQEEKYLKITMNSMPKKLNKYVKFFHRNIYVKKREGINMSFYENLPDINFDYVYEDRRDHESTPIAGDLLEIEEKNLKKNIPFNFTIDDMFITQNVLKQKLKQKYSISRFHFSGTNYNQII